ncbi:MAG: hypothetical protein PHQ75_10670 [Thermoguttaceae bacterium]|nr:hypothetical protein [Thermoguttaceae bacterium]
MQELKINPEFASLLPPLTDEEFSGLEADIIENGCRDALVVSNGFLIDGHNRLIICKKHHIKFSTVEMTFDSDDDAKIWIWKNQGNRRNLTPLAKIELAAKMKPVLEARAKARQLAVLKRGNKTPVVEILPQREHSKVRDELAEQAGVSGRTFDKGVYVLENADEETKDRLRRGEKGLSISGVYKDLKAQEALENQTDEVPVASPEEIEVPETVPAETTAEPENPYREEISKIVHENVDKYHFDCVNLMHIPKYQTVQLRNCLFKLFTCEYRVNLVVELIEEMVTEDGKEVVSDLMKTLKKKFK